MRFDDKLKWAKFESKGYPNDTVTVHATPKEIMFRLLKWMQDTRINKRMVIVISVDEEGLNTKLNGGETKMDLSAELEALFDEIQPKGEE